VLGGAHRVVGGGHHAEVAGGQAQVDLVAAEGRVLGGLFGQDLAQVAVDVGVVVLAEILHRGDHAVDGGGAVVRGEDRHRHGAAVGIQQAGVGLEVLGGLAQGVGVTRQHAPARRAVVPAGVHQLGGGRQGDHLLDALDVLHVPGEAVDQLHRRVAGGAGRGAGFGDDVHDVHA